MSEPTPKPQTARKPYSEFTETVKLSPEEEAARKRRNLMIALGLAAFIALIFVTTVVRMSSNYNAGA
jgi:hypothetical protein